MDLLGSNSVEEFLSLVSLLLSAFRWVCGWIGTSGFVGGCMAWVAGCMVWAGGRSVWLYGCGVWASTCP